MKNFYQKNGGSRQRFPFSYKGINVNCCKFTTCENFGIPAGEVVIAENNEFHINQNHHNPFPKRDPLYAISGTDKFTAALKCKACERRNQDKQTKSGNSSYMLKSNLAVVEELERISAYLKNNVPICPNGLCPTVTHHRPQNIVLRGLTAKGTQRYLCKCCGRTFTHTRHRKKQPHYMKVKSVMQDLVRKMPLSEIIFDEIDGKGIAPKTLYDRIHFIHQQCMDFVADRESKLADLNKKRIYLSTDRIVQYANWRNRKYKQNVELYGIGTACRDSGYVFALNFNFDPTLNAENVNKEAALCGDLERPKHMRKFARVWLNEEFFNEKIQVKQMVINDGDTNSDAISSLQNKIDFDEYQNQNMSSETIDKFTDLPKKGMLIHNEYTQMAHFFFLKELFKNIEFTRFYLDLDSGMSNAYITAFKEEISLGRSEGYSVMVSKELTKDEKIKIRNENYRQVRAFQKRAKSTTPDGTPVPPLDLETSSPVLRHTLALMLVEHLDNPIRLPNSSFNWYQHPLPLMSEPNKMISPLTPMKDFQPIRIGHLLRKGTLHPIDRFFMQLRRKVSIFERPSNASKPGRQWYIYSAYNPAMYQILGDIYRVYYNYVKLGKDKKTTPAMKLGLAEKQISLEQIIYFSRD